MNNENEPKVDPGWNDPPMLNYSASSPPPKSRIGNKRVAFPLDSSSSTLLQAQPTNLPSSAPPLPVPDFTIEKSRKYLESFFSSENYKENFNKIWQSEVPDGFKKSLRLMAECSAKNNKLGAEIHKQELLNQYESLSKSWLNDIKFQ